MIFLRLFHFMGSAAFAIILIVSTLLFVIAGTLLEAWSGSHLFAAQLIYQNFLFTTLLWLYFFNILISALRRWPFQKKHLPFLTTHLGLLMILGGVLLKAHFGLQGYMSLPEGGGSSHIFLPQSFALHVENREKAFLIPLKKQALGIIKQPFPELKLTLLEWTPHSEERYEGWIKRSGGSIVGLPPFPVFNLGAQLPKTLPVSLKTHACDLSALKTDSLEEILSRSFPGKSCLYFIQDSNQQEHLLAFNEHGEKFSQKLNYEEFLIFDKGFGGYGVSARLPQGFPDIELFTQLTHVCEPLPAHPKQEKLKPRLCLLASDGQHSEVVALSYDPFGARFKWPLLGGKYLIRFQSQREKIPFSIRLREARQINYPHSNRPFSFESDLLFDEEEATISMNKVYERKGYRFYMANLMSNPLSAKKAEIVVNYDPAKYWLTYPGGIVLALGIVLLYVRKHV